MRERRSTAWGSHPAMEGTRLPGCKGLTVSAILDFRVKVMWLSQMLRMRGETCPGRDQAAAVQSGPRLIVLAE